VILNDGVRIEDGIQKINNSFDEKDVLRPSIISKEELKQNYRNYTNSDNNG